MALRMKALPIISFLVSGPSMHPTYKDSKRIFVNRLAYFFSNPKKGDIVVLQHPLKENYYIVKRVAATEGTKVDLQWGRLFFNKQRVGDIHYTDIFFDEGKRSQQWNVPRDHCFVLGDNPPRSSDSRHFGTVHKNTIVGKVM